MRAIVLLFSAFMLTGCVIYPSRHISEPSYEVSIAGESILDVVLTSSLDAKDGSCEGGKTLEYAGDNKYISDPEYGWIKVAFAVPIYAYKPIKICAIGNMNRAYYWTENIGILGNDYPNIFKFKCEIKVDDLFCEKIST